MKHIQKKLSHFYSKKMKKASIVGSILLVGIIVVGVSFFKSPIHDAELRFSEKSNDPNIVGSILPASCESGGNGLVGPGHTSGCAWTQYCTGNDPTNPWQIWEYSNDDSIDYRFTGAGCQPTVPSNLVYTCNNADGTSATLQWTGGANTTSYAPRFSVLAAQACPAGWTKWTDGTTCYVDGYGASSVAIPTVQGQSYAWWIHASNAAGTNWAANYSTAVCYSPTGSLSVSSPSCTIATGASSCNLNLTWNTTNPFGTSAVTQNNPNQTAHNGNNGGPASTAVNGPPGSTTFYLYNSGYLLDSKVVSTSCNLGGWDTIGGACANPTGSSNASGNYYGPGTFNFTCTNSNGYRVRRDGTLVASVTNGSYVSGTPTSIPISIEGNYQVECIQGSYSNLVPPSFFTSPPPPPPAISISASPRTIAKDAQTTISWNVQFPPAPADGTCSLAAVPVCTNGICNASQTAAAAALNTILSTGNTDSTDPNTSRPISAAVSNFAPGHGLPNGDFRTIGRKTLRLTNTTDFVLTCTNNTAPSSSRTATARVLITTNNEQ